MTTTGIASSGRCTSGIQLEHSWKDKLVDEFDKPYLQELRQFLNAQKRAKKIIYPKGEDIFRAFEYTPYEATKVVILGQDPYHGPHQAHGLCFSVKPHVKIPPSLRNIYQELNHDLNVSPAAHGCLTSWAKQGVLLLNSVLTVEQGKAGSHQAKGWEVFTDKVIQCLNSSKRPLVFILWGSYAQKKGQCIDGKRHCVLKAPHPSPLSAHRGFFGSRPFSKANQFLVKNGQAPILWELPEKIYE